MLRESRIVVAFFLVGLGICISSASAGIWTDPDSFDLNVTEGCTRTDTLTVGNDGPGDLSFKVRTRIVGDSGVSTEGIDRLSTAGKAAVSSGSRGRDFTVPGNVPYKPDELIVRFAAKADGKQRSSEEKSQIVNSMAGGTIKREFRIVPGLSVVKLPAGMTVEKALQTFNKASGVLYAHANYRVEALSTFPNDPRFNELWGMHNTGQTGGTVDADIDAPEAWDIGTGSKDIIVAVIDTGVDYTHPDLAANMWVNQAELNGIAGVDDDNNGYVDDIYGYDFCNYDGDPMDDHYHGTHCAGTIGAIGNNGVGVAGVCWNVKIMALKFLDSGGYGWSEDAIRCIEYSVQMGANLSSNSWGGGDYDQGLKDAIDAAGAVGMLFVAAAGNSGENSDEYPLYPAAYDSSCIISVMATDHTDGKSDFSNYGPTSVDLGAPGSDILSCQPGGGYQYLSGTSMATPHVSGACALVWSMNPALSSSEVKEILLRTVDPTLSGQCVSGGRLNLYNAICETKAPWIKIEPEEGTIGAGQSIELSVTFDALELAPGTYRAEIVVVSNDTDNPRKAIPVTMTVNADDLVVTPGEGLESSGAKSGPFEPRCRSYTLTNRGSGPVNWTTLPTEDWLTVTPTEGTLGPGSSVDVNVCIGVNANLLDPNLYTDTVTFLNTDSGSIKPRSVSLTVKPPDCFTESLDANGCDFALLSLTFTPSVSAAYYEACREEVQEFPTDPNGGTYVALWDDDFAEVILTGGAKVLFYGHWYDRIYIGSNGYITFGQGDAGRSGTLAEHFNMPRISGLFTDLNPPNGRCISYKQLEDRVVVTYEDVPVYGDKTAENSFQTEMFFVDGTIRITWLKVAATSGVAGLSEGKGLPPVFFVESDLSAYPVCWPLGDYDKDYTVGLTDLGIFVSHWLDNDCNAPYWCGRTDLDFSGTVQAADFAVFAGNWRMTKEWMPSPIAHWKFDEGTGTIAYDSAGDNDGTIYGPTWTTGQVDGALSFDGVNDYVDVPDDSSLRFTQNNSFSICAWVKPTSVSGDGEILCKMQTSGAENLFTYESFWNSANQTFDFVICQSYVHFVDVATPTGSAPAGSWYHVACIYENRNMRIYINGELKASGYFPYDTGTNTADKDVGIGARLIGSGTENYFKGTLDDIRLYNLALSAEEVWQLYREGLSDKASAPNPADGQGHVDPNAVLTWLPGKDAVSHDVYFGTDFDEVNDATTASDVYMGNQYANWWDVNSYDSNGLELDTTFYWRIDEAGPTITAKGDVWAFTTRSEVDVNFVNWWKFDEGTGTIAYDSAGDDDGTIYGATWTTGQIDGALSFDGVNDYVDCGSGPSNYDNITVSAWMKTSTEGILVSNRYGSYSYGTWYTLSSMDIELGDSGGYQHLNFNTPTLDGVWHHIVYTKDGINHAVYVDGSLDQSFTSNADISWSNPTFIGRRWTKSSSGNAWFNGPIDDVRIYNRALSADEVWQLYRKGLSCKASNPNPADGTANVDPNAVLSWLPGKDAVSHDVYFGTDFDEVNDATTASDVYMGNQDANWWDANNYDSNGLEPDTMFYWRIDEISTAGTTKGDVWGFRTAPGGEVNLVGWWMLNEGTGSTAGDSSGNNYNGTITGATWFNDPVHGWCLNFDGSGDWVSIPDTAALNITGDITIAAWVYLAKGGAEQSIVAKTLSNGHTNSPFDFRTSVGNPPILDIVRSDASGHEAVHGTQPVPLNSWHHVLVRVENKFADFYIDGVITDSYGTLTKTPTVNSKPLYIGRRDDGSYFTGRVNAVRIYDRALSAEEIWQLYQSGL